MKMTKSLALVGGLLSAFGAAADECYLQSRS